MRRKARIIFRAAKNIIPPKAVSDAKRSFLNISAQPKYFTEATL